MVGGGGGGGGGLGIFLEKLKVTYYAMKISPFRPLHTTNLFRNYDRLELDSIISYIMQSSTSTCIH